MASISNDEAKIILASKIDAGLDVLLFGGNDNVVTIKASGASSSLVTSRRGAAGIVGPISPEIGDSLVDAANMVRKFNGGRWVALTSIAHP